MHTKQVDLFHLVKFSILSVQLRLLLLLLMLVVFVVGFWIKLKLKQVVWVIIEPLATDTGAIAQIVWRWGGATSGEFLHRLVVIFVLTFDCLYAISFKVVS